MNHRRLLLLPAVILVLLIFSMAGAGAENLLENGDFSELDQDHIPVGWYTDAYIAEPGYTRYQAAEGDEEHPHAVSIQNIGENDARYAQTVEVEPDSLYLLSGYILAEGIEGGHGANLSVEGIYAFSERLYDTEGEWQYIEYYGETGPDQHTVTVFARLGGYSGVCTGKASFADLSLTKADSIPGDCIADLWYRESSYAADDEDTEAAGSEGAFWPRFLLICLVYGAAALYVIDHERSRRSVPGENRRTSPVCVAGVMIAGLLLRLVICWFVEGYMVDVNCFLSWGSTMASVGPGRFYEATNFCDYPPLYTYVLAAASSVTGLLGNGEETARVVFRTVPCICDIAGCWILYRLLIQQENVKHHSCFLFLILCVLNPALILNSAAWGQMDSVLCLVLLAVAVSAIRGSWITALPLYVVAVLIKPQALMLGPLGLLYIILTWVRDPESRKPVFRGVGISLLVLAAGVIPFSIHQRWDWLIQLYGRTLASYPYTTVNTANFWYILGGNWNAVGNSANILAPILLSVLCAVYGCWWYVRAKEQPGRLAETVISVCFSCAFILCAVLNASWAWNGGIAMAFAFVIVLGPAIRSRNIRLLPWLGGLLYILLYVFGVKMHERYLFPALFLIAAAWIMIRDNRILHVLLLFSMTMFINEGIVLDNSIRLGSALGHLNEDTVWLADIISSLNIAGAVYAVWLSIEILLPGHTGAVQEAASRSPLDWRCDRKLHWNRKDTVILALITAVYTLISLLTLGSTKAPQTCWSSSGTDEQVVFDLGENRNGFEILYFAQVSRNDFSISVSSDGEQWSEEMYAQMDQGQCWKWKYVTESFTDGEGERNYYNGDENHIIRFSGRYVRLTSCQLGLRLNEILFRDEEGNILPAVVSGHTGAESQSELYSDPAALLDEQDTMENLPSFAGTQMNDREKTQPSWWNSTYFDEIYHARTAYEFLQGSVPYETSHPPLGKVLMSLSVALFGMTPFGWRFAGAAAGIMMLPGMYLLGKQLTKKTGIAVLACLLMALDCMHLTQTQIATIDSFPVLFIIFAYLFMLRFLQTDFVREKRIHSMISLAFSGLFMGLSIASKWIGIYAGAGLAVLYFWHCLRVIRVYREAGRMHEDGTLSEPERKRLHDLFPDTGFQKAISDTLVLCAWCVLFFVLLPAAIYLLSYIPYMAYASGRIHSLADYVTAVWQAQVGMFNYHSTPNLGMDHPFYSPWWEWPVIGKPMYYASQQYLPRDYPVHHSIFCFGNPVIWYGGLAAIVFCVFRFLRRRRYGTVLNDSDALQMQSGYGDPRTVFIVIGLLAQYLPWVLVPRGTYIYHYFASLPFLMAATSVSFDGYGTKRKRIVLFAACAFLTAAAVFFVILFPYAGGINVPDSWLDIGRHILRIWY